MLRESRVPHAILISKELDALWLEAAWLSYFLRVIVLWLQLRIDSSQEDSDTKGTLRILARSGLAVLLSTGDCNVASTKSREFPMQFLYRRNLMNFGPKRLGSTIFYGGLYWGFYRKSRVPHKSFDTEGT